MDSLFHTMAEQIAIDIKKQIIAGEVEEGSPLREIELATRYNVSRGPVRDALKLLSKEGFAIAKPNVGVKVAPQPSEPVLTLILEVRKQLENLALDSVFDELTEEDYDYLRKILNRIDVACKEDDIYTVEELDIQFHRYLINKYDDKHLLDLWEMVINRMMFRYTRLPNLYDVYEEHSMILQAIETNNKPRALGLLAMNIQ